MPRVLFDDDGDSIDTVNSNKVGLNNQSTVNKNVQTKHRSKEDSKRTLFDSDEEDPEESNHPGTSDQLTINKIYAESYDVWRRKEDYQKLKDKYGEESDSDDSDTSDDDGFAEPDNPEFDMDFFRTLAAIRTNHPILKEKENFFKSSYESKSKKVESKEKPITVKDFERKLLLEREGKYDEEEEEEDLTYKKRFVFENIPTQSQKITFDDNLSDDDEDLFEKKTKPSAEKGSEDEQEPENEALEFLKGKKSTLKDETDTQLLSSLKKDWETDMSAEDKYLMDYFVNQRYLEEEDENVSRDPHHRPLDIEPLEDDEETYEKMESYETKYRFRFEEPDEEFIRRYPRKTDDAVRKDDEKRKQEREKKKKLENDKEEQRKQEMLRLKAWKKKEIMERINELEEASGKKMAFDDLDLNEDFDPDQHDAAMSKMFDDNYYGESESKPNFQDDEIEQELMDEYKKLEDLDSMTEGSFRYVDVFASSFGLTTEEILYAKDTELNRWYSMKKILNVNLPESKEKMYSTSYIKRANTDTIKKRILPSLFTEDLEDQWKAEEERKRKRNEKKKERRVRKTKKEEEEKSKEEDQEIVEVKEEQTVKDEIKEDQDEEMEYSDNENLEDEVNSSIDNLNIKNKVKKKRKSSDTNESIHKIKHEVKKERKIKQDQEENEIEDSGDESQDNEDKVNSSLDNLNIKKKQKKKKRKLSDTNETIQIIKQEVNEQQVKERKIKHEIKEEQNEKIEDSDNESHEDEVSSSSCNLKSKNKKKRKLSDSSETIQIIKQEVNEQQIKQVKERKIKHEIKEQNEKLEDSDKETLEDEVSSSSCNLKSKTEKKRKLSDSSETKHKIKQEVKEEHETIEDTDNISQENEEETINSCNIKNEKQKKKKRKSSGTDEITGVEDVQKTTKIVQKDKNKNYQNKNTSSINKDKTIKGKLKGHDHSNTRLNHSNAKPKRKEFEVTKSHNSKFEHKQNRSNKLKRKNPQNFKPDDERVKGISDSRLAAYGANPKKIKRFLQYGKK